MEGKNRKTSVNWLVLINSFYINNKSCQDNLSLESIKYNAYFFFFLFKYSGIHSLVII